MNILLTGASGFLGRCIHDALVAQGHRVRPISRTHGIDCGVLQHASDWIAHLEGIDAVVNCAGIIAESDNQRFDAVHTIAPIALFQACTQSPQVRRVIQVSALGADASAFSAFHRSKCAADDALRAMDLEWFVLRPSLIYGQGGTSATLFLRMARLPWLCAVGDGQQPVQPVHISDCVATVLHCLSSTQTRLTLDLVGPEVFTWSQWLQCMRRAQGLPTARVIHIPVCCALAGASLLQSFSPLLQTANVRMLLRGSHASVGPLARFLGHMPRAVQPALFFTAAGTTPHDGVTP